jgi:hypothetical protein
LNIIFVLTAGSDSNDFFADGTTELEAAKIVLMQVLENLPSDTKIGVIVARTSSIEPASCKENIEIIVSFPSAVDIPATQDTLQDVTSRGLYPLAKALHLTAETLPPFTEGVLNVVVVFADSPTKPVLVDNCQWPLEAAVPAIEEAVSGLSARKY